MRAHVRSIARCENSGRGRSWMGVIDAGYVIGRFHDQEGWGGVWNIVMKDVRFLRRPLPSAHLWDPKNFLQICQSYAWCFWHLLWYEKDEWGTLRRNSLLMDSRKTIHFQSSLLPLINISGCVDDIGSPNLVTPDQGPSSWLSNYHPELVFRRVSERRRHSCSSICTNTVLTPMLKTHKKW